jgi:hypothetical protein
MTGALNVIKSGNKIFTTIDLLQKLERKLHKYVYIGSKVNS